MILPPGTLQTGKPMSTVHANGAALRRLAGAGIAALLVASGCGWQESSERMLHEARRLYAEQHDRSSAIIQLKNSLQKQDNAEARLLLGVIYNELRDGKAAEKELRRAQELGLVAGGKVRAELARAMFVDGQFRKVVDEIKPSPSFEAPSLAAIYALRGRALVSSRAVAEARNMYQEAAKVDPEALDVLLLQAVLRFIDNDSGGAMELLARTEARYPRSIEVLMMKADMLRLQKKHDETLAAYAKVIEIEPKFLAVRIARASFHISNQKLDDAQADLDAIFRIAKNYPQALYLQALVHLQNGKYREAQAAILEVLKVLPRYPPALLLAGSINYGLGSFAQAERALAQFLQSYPDNAYARKLQAAALIELNEGKRALEIIQPMLAKNLQDSSVYALAGDAHMKAGDYGKATELLEKASALEPDNVAVRTSLAVGRLQAGDTERAIADLEVAAHQSGGSRAEFILILTHLRAGQFDKATEAIRALEKKLPDNPMVHNFLGAAYLGKKDLGRARGSFERALSIAADYFPAAANLAQMDLAERNIPAARKRFEGVLAKDGKHYRAMMELAALGALSGDLKEAVKWLERAIAQNPKAIEPYIQLAGYNLQGGDVKRAFAVATEAQRLQPDNPQVLDAVGLSQIANGDRNSALATFNRYVTVSPKSPLAHYRVASAKALLNDYKGAEASLITALALKPGYLDAMDSLGRVQLRLKRYDEATRTARQILKLHPKSSAGHVLEGDVAYAQSRFTEAAKLFDSALGVSRTGAGVARAYMAHVRAGTSAAGDATLAQWVKDNPNDMPMRELLADGMLQARQYQLAAQHYEYILQKLPNSPHAMNNLAETYRQLKDPRALGIAEKAASLDPADALVQDTLGWILFEQGQTARALEVLRNAAARAPDRPVIRYHFAAALAKSGDRAAARKELVALLAKNKNFAGIEDARNLLKQL